MKKEIIATDAAPAAIGPYSQAVSHGQLIFTSGQIPLDPKTNELVIGDIQAQTRQVFENLKAVLEAAGSDLDQALKVTVYLKDMGDYAAVNEVYAEYFTSDFPSRSAVQVAKLPKDVGIEIDVIAHKKA